MSTQIEKWIEASGITRITERTSHRFPLQLSFRDDNGSFYFGKKSRTRVNTKYDRYLSWSGRTRTSDTLRRSRNVFEAGSEL